jgi:hypothetical protein
MASMFQAKITSTHRNVRFAFVVTLISLLSFVAGRSSLLNTKVRADSGGAAEIEVRDINGGSSLVVFYPSINKVFVYANPFAGSSTWPCAYSFQLSTPGGAINRQPCPALQ